MKKWVCCLLAVLLTALSIIVSLGNVIAYAEDASVAEEPLFFADKVDFSCRFDTETSKIHLGGQIRHDVFITHRDYKVEVYAVPPGADAETVIRDSNTRPVAGSDIAIRFEFALDAKDILNKYSRYSVVLRSPDGSHVLASEPKFAEVASDFSIVDTDRSAYKGLSTPHLSEASNAGAGRVVLPIYFDRLISQNASGYVYQTGTDNLYFDKAYVEFLDVSIRSATVSGAEVYLQYLVSQGETQNIPDVYDTRILATIEAVTAFLSDRYDGAQGGRLDGIVVGREVDRSAKGLPDAPALVAYAEKYALYVIAVANTARRKNPTTDIVLPFSETNSYMAPTQDFAAPSAFLEAVITFFDVSFSDRFVCTTLIETRTTPLHYPAAWEHYDAPLTMLQDDTVLHAANAECYAQYLDHLRSRYASAPQAFMLLWQVEDGLSGNALSAAYTYSYFRLIGEDALTSFVVATTDREQKGMRQGFSELSHVFAYIDTSECLEVTNPILGYFAADSWADLQRKPYEGSYALRSLYHAPASRTLSAEIKGSFSYFDFSTSVNLNTWFFGFSCQNIRLNYHTLGGKALQMEMEDVNGYAEAFCLYEYPENFIFTPYIAFRLGVDVADRENAPTLYEVTLTSGTGRSQIVGTTVISAGGVDTVVLDLSAYTEKNLSDYWKISVRPLDGEGSNYSLWIYDIVGYSTEMSSEELAEAIEAERLRIRNLGNPNDDDGSGYERLWTVVGMVCVVLMIGVGIFILLRQNDEKEKKNESDES